MSWEKVSLYLTYDVIVKKKILYTYRSVFARQTKWRKHQHFLFLLCALNILPAIVARAPQPSWRIVGVFLWTLLGHERDVISSRYKLAWSPRYYVDFLPINLIDSQIRVGRGPVRSRAQLQFYFWILFWFVDKNNNIVL